MKTIVKAAKENGGLKNFMNKKITLYEVRKRKENKRDSNENTFGTSEPQSPQSEV